MHFIRIGRHACDMDHFHIQSPIRPLDMALVKHRYKTEILDLQNMSTISEIEFEKIEVPSPITVTSPSKPSS